MRPNLPHSRRESQNVAASPGVRSWVYSCLEARKRKWSGDRRTDTDEDPMLKRCGRRKKENNRI